MPAPSWEAIYKQADGLTDDAEKLILEIVARHGDRVKSRGAALSALERIRRLHHHLGELAAEIVLRGAADGASQEALARALGMPASSLRGARKEALS